MPVIDIKMTQISKETKKEIISKVTAAMVEATKIPAKAFTVIINEVHEENIGLGGTQLSEIEEH